MGWERSCAIGGAAANAAMNCPMNPRGGGGETPGAVAIERNQAGGGGTGPGSAAMEEEPQVEGDSWGATAGGAATAKRAAMVGALAASVREGEER